MDRLESMSILVGVAEAGSLSGAARRLHMPLASLSRKISALESHLGVKLLNRSTRLLTLTDAGQSYLTACKRILEDVAAAEREAAGEYRTPRGELSMTTAVTFGRVHMLPVVAEFLRLYPEIDARLTFNDRVVNLQEEHIDVAARIGKLPDSGLRAVRIGEVKRVICASPDYLAAHGTPAHPSELINHGCVSFEPMSLAAAWDFPLGNATAMVPVRSRLVVGSADATIDAALAGVGIARVFSYHIANAERAGTLVRVLREFEPAAMPVHLVYPAGGQIPLKLRVFLDFATPRLRERLGEGK